MAQPTKTVAQFMSENFSKSAKAISERLNTEEYNDFTSEAKEASDRIEALQDGNAKVKADYEAQLTRANTAEASLTELQGKYTALEKEKNDLQATNTKLQGWYDQQESTIKNSKSKEEAGNQAGMPEHLSKLAANHPDRVAYEMVLANQAKRK
ncbi:hypothetical protein [Siphonobacter sp. SORGH_AS_0500]|uniref:hypothetical protein n=1 Tax=Siphonobacter sp. SORGH_AS_0500 TaxID=1864824 RepID=UPI002857BE1A|nr:hypothetical protein [Siphonobacter sp. SORGH_AS_0500]MDR6195626.1 chromosome segregation ATPase [Siphonobacter sp. SORGH_AS_0500]